jgi:hypothetical protein
VLVRNFGSFFRAAPKLLVFCQPGENELKKQKYTKKPLTFLHFDLPINTFPSQFLLQLQVCPCLFNFPKNYFQIRISFHERKTIKIKE